MVEPEAASIEEIAHVHAPADICVVQRYSATPMLALGMDGGQWGFVPGMDTVATAGMHEAAALDGLLVHLGADIHHADPLAHLQSRSRRLSGSTRRSTSSPMLSAVSGSLRLPGGGYNPTNLGRFWALQLEALAGVAVDDVLPESWRDAVRVTLGTGAPRRLRDEATPGGDGDQRAAADAQGPASVAVARGLLS